MAQESKSSCSDFSPDACSLDEFYATWTERVFDMVDKFVLKPDEEEANVSEWQHARECDEKEPAYSECSPEDDALMISLDQIFTTWTDRVLTLVDEHITQSKRVDVEDAKNASLSSHARGCETPKTPSGKCHPTDGAHSLEELYSAWDEKADKMVDDLLS